MEHQQAIRLDRQREGGHALERAERRGTGAMEDQAIIELYWQRNEEAVRATAEQSSLLSVPMGEALLHLNCYFVDREDRPLCIGRQYYIGGRYMIEV